MHFPLERDLCVKMDLCGVSPRKTRYFHDIKYIKQYYIYLRQILLLFYARVDRDKYYYVL